ncbi:hypothetical protein Tco_1340285, partial [Tanacetum coccineum]
KLLQEMDNPNTTMEEYVQFETEIALRHAIIYDDALKLESNFSSKPALNYELINSVNLENKTSLPERDYEEYNFISEIKALKKRFSKKEKFNILNIDEDLFSYENSSDKNLQLDKGNDDDKIVKLDTEYPIRRIDMALPLRNERHEWLRFDTQGYTEEEQLDFETRLDKLYYRKVHRVLTLDFEGLIEDLDMDMTERLRIVDEMETDGFRAYWADCLRGIASKVALADYWTRISSSGDFLGSAPSYILIRVPLRMLCHRLIAFNIFDRGQAPEKVTTNDLFYLRSMDEGTVVNVPYLLVIREQSLQTLTVEVRELPTIDKYELIRLRMCERLLDVGKRMFRLIQHLNKGHRCLKQSLLRLLHRGCRELRSRMTELMEQRGMKYQGYNGRILADTHLEYERHKVMQMTDYADDRLCRYLSSADSDLTLA